MDVYTCIPLYMFTYYKLCTSGVNNTELFDAEPRLLVIDAEPRLSFSEEKKRALAEPRL